MKHQLRFSKGLHVKKTGKTLCHSLGLFGDTRGRRRGSETSRPGDPDSRASSRLADSWPEQGFPDTSPDRRDGLEFDDTSILGQIFVAASLPRHGHRHCGVCRMLELDLRGVHLIRYTREEIEDAELYVISEVIYRPGSSYAAYAAPL